MAIKENQLPTAQEVTENNLIRTVDENGASQNMTVDQLGGLVGGGEIFLITATYHQEEEYTDLDKTWQEIHDAYYAGKMCYIVKHEEGEGEDYSHYSDGRALVFLVSQVNDINGDYEENNYSVESIISNYSTRDADDYPRA